MVAELACNLRVQTQDDHVAWVTGERPFEQCLRLVRGAELDEQMTELELELAPLLASNFLDEARLEQTCQLFFRLRSFVQGAQRLKGFLVGRIELQAAFQTFGGFGEILGPPPNGM